MKRLVSFLLIFLLLVVVCSSSLAEKTTLLPSINMALRSGLGNDKIEISNQFDDYSLENEPFEEFNNDIKVLILQREAPQKKFTAKKFYPPFSDTDGFPDDFNGVDIGTTRVWLRSDLMKKIPSEFRATSLENATYLIIAENLYLFEGTLVVSDFKSDNDEPLPEFESAEEMAEYFLEHPRKVDSMTYYPKFAAYSFVTWFDKKTKKCSLWDYNYYPAKRFARNPEASDHWENMTYLLTLYSKLNDNSSIDPDSIIDMIEELDFVPEDKRNIWVSCIKAKEYGTVSYSINDFFWNMAKDLAGLDSDAEHKQNYEMIIKDQNALALSQYVNYCDYSGFDRSINSIEFTKEYISSPDPEWMESVLKDNIALFNQ